jgi:hypothetical protein
MLFILWDLLLTSLVPKAISIVMIMTSTFYIRILQSIDLSPSHNYNLHLFSEEYIRLGLAKSHRKHNLCFRNVIIILSIQYMLI